jgi:hypothetical protein
MAFAYLSIKHAQMLSNGHGKRSKGQDGRMEHVEGELSVDGCALSRRRDHQPVASARNQSTAVDSRLIQRLVHTKMVVVETTAMNLKLKESRIP